MNAFNRNFERQAPQNIDAEQALLGAILVNNDAMGRVNGVVDAEDFNEPLHKAVFEVAKTMIEAGKNANPITMKAYLPAAEKVGDLTVAEYLIRLAAEAVTIINAPDYAASVRDHAERRRIISIADEMSAAAYAPTVAATPRQIVDNAEARFVELFANHHDDGQSDRIDDVANNMLAHMSEADARPSIPLPLPQLREILGGDMEAGRLVGMLSASGEGKTSMALQIADHAAVNGHPVMVLSFDQSQDEILRQLACQRAGVDSNRVRNRTWMEKEAERFFDEVASIRTLPLRIKRCNASFDTAGHLVGHVKRSLLRLCEKAGKPGLVILDHSRKVKPHDDRAHEGRIAAHINGVFKQAAEDMDLVWFNLMQRPGAGVKRKNPRPIGADVFGGEMGKEDYDAIFYLYRGWKYWQEQLAIAEDAKDEDRINGRFGREKWQEDQAELGILKWRFGNASQRFRVRFEAEFTRYVSMRPEQDPQLFEAGL